MALRYCLYGTLGCHLCELAEQLLLPHVSSGVIEVELFDIVEDEKLLERYGIHIPVLVAIHDGSELFWPWDRERLAEFLNN